MTTRTRRTIAAAALALAAIGMGAALAAAGPLASVADIGADLADALTAPEPAPEAAPVCADAFTVAAAEPVGTLDYAGGRWTLTAPGAGPLTVGTAAAEDTPATVCAPADSRHAAILAPYADQ